MRLLLATIDFAPAPGGVQNLLGRLAHGLAQSGHGLTVVAPGDRTAAAWDRVQPYRVVRTRPSAPARAALLPLALGTLAVAARRQPDVVVCGHVLLGPVCRLLARAARVPYVAMAYAFEVRSPRMRRVAAHALRDAARVVTISEFSRRDVVSLGVEPARIAVILPGPAVEAPADNLAPDLPPGPPILVTVGRLAEAYKGHDMVVRAMPLVLARVPDARWVVVGDGPLRGYLERMARAYGVASAVTFTGRVPDDALDEWYRRCSLLVLPGRESARSGEGEGFGIVFVEANLRGRPVVGGRTGGIPDAVLDGVTGLLVDPEDPAAIADAIVRLLTDGMLAARLGAAGRRRAQEDLAWSRYVRRFETLLVEVTTRCPSLSST